jgi:uncharacterized membrane protein YbhN (UPF0104 family)
MAISKEVIDKIAALMTAAFGLVAALAWNDAIKSTIASLGLEAYGPWLYAIVVTILAVVVTLYIGRVASRAQGLAEKQARAVKSKAESVKRNA